MLARTIALVLGADAIWMSASATEHRRRTAPAYRQIALTSYSASQTSMVTTLPHSRQPSEQEVSSRRRMLRYPTRGNGGFGEPRHNALMPRLPRMQQTISEITRRDIFDFITIENIDWSGRLEETAFLERLWDLNDMRSTDSRFKNAAGDIWQRRVDKPTGLGGRLGLH